MERSVQGVTNEELSMLLSKTVDQQPSAFIPRSKRKRKYFSRWTKIIHIFQMGK